MKTLLALGCLGSLALAGLPVRADEHWPSNETRDPTPCNGYYCNPGDQKCWGPAQTHCVLNWTFPNAAIQDGDIVWGEPVMVCTQKACDGNGHVVWK